MKHKYDYVRVFCQIKLKVCEIKVHLFSILPGTSIDLQAPCDILGILCQQLIDGKHF